ncbi:hypothetical protein Ocin01_12444 [Orchesella cincta]|uniref:Uncharacterized protein n=1 Tax=Orchesella cincta TaxID=48709 RepID=A0A1D2MME1_ORCCI|nr:hypothetical protein Ocin01_12444 [Orchesella cincta]
MPLCPCPCMSLELGVIVVAVIDAVLYCHTSIYAFIDVYTSRRYYFDYPDYDQRANTARKTIEVANFLLHVTAILMAIVLFAGSRKKSAVMCWAWIGHTVAFAVIFITFLIFIDAIVRHQYYKSDPTLNLLGCLWLAIQLYFVGIVYAFIRSLRPVDPQQAKVELGGSTPADPQPSAIGQEGAVSPHQTSSQTEVEPV